MSTHDNYNLGSRQKPIDQSLNQLKKLEWQLQQKNQQQAAKSVTSKKTDSTHARWKTESYDFNGRNNLSVEPALSSFFTDSTKMKKNNSLSVERETMYTHSQPLMAERNQSEEQSIDGVVKENKELRKYINWLLEMNQYLKNQLIARQSMPSMHGRSNEFEVEDMKMQIAQLQKVNDERQGELRKMRVDKERKNDGERGKGRSKSGVKKNTSGGMKNTIDGDCVGKSQENKYHHRSSSTYAMSNSHQKINYNIDEKSEQEEQYDQYPQLHPQSIISLNQRTKKKGGPQVEPMSEQSRCKNANPKQSGSAMKKKVENRNELKKKMKCRLCYF